MTVESDEGERLARLRDEINRRLAEFMPRPLRFRYFAKGNGPMFYWTTERDDDGKYHSGVYAPVGKGSRSGKAKEWHLDIEQESKHALRKDAKARALRLFIEWRDA